MDKMDSVYKCPGKKHTQNWQFYLKLSVEYSTVLIGRVTIVVKELFSGAGPGPGDRGLCG